MTDEHNNFHPEDGFTLVEMLAVMAIIAVLMTGAALAIIPQVQDSRIKGTKASMRTLSTAITQYNFTMGTYPEELDDLVTPPRDSDLAARFPQGGFLMTDNVPTDAWRTEFVYTIPGETRPFDLVSFGADKQPGGEGENADLSVWDN